MLTPAYSLSCNFYRTSSISLLLSFLVACGGGGGGDDDEATPPAPPPPSTQTYSVGGAVTGLSGNNAVVLQNNGGNALTISNAGEFTFTGAVSQGATYNVTVATQPAGKTCAVNYGGGTVGNTAVKNIAVNCTPSPGAIDVNGPNTLSATHKPTLVGVVIDSAVGNLRYDGPATLDGTTNDQGQFNYQPGDLITFKVGDIALPAVTGKPIITVVNFAGSNDINNTTLVNIARFLQSLDSDGDPTNGISIPESAHTAGTGQTLNFGSASFDTAAGPIVASAIPGRTLVSPNTAIAHVQSTLDNLPKLVPIAGGWTTGTGVNMRAVILLENGMYYGVEGNCSATNKPGYEYGTYAYSGSALVLAVSADANGACGLNTGARTATLSGNSLTLDGATWTDVSYSAVGLSGLYAYKGYIGGADNDAELSLLTATQYIVLRLNDGLTKVEVTVGTYTWGGNSSPAATFTPLASLTPEASSTSNILRNQSYVLEDNSGFISMNIAVRPARATTTLPGLWTLDDEGDVTSADLTYPLVFTPDGKYIYLGNDPACPGLVRSAAGEFGSYAWDVATGAFSLSITGDSNGVCGIADENNLTSATVTGNLLNFSSTQGSGTFVKPSAPTLNDATQNSAVGIWKQTAGSGALTLLVSGQVVGTNIGGGNIQGLLIKAIDSNCPNTGTSYAVESLTAAVDAGGPNDIAALSTATNYDTVGCGLPTTLGPTYSVVGDTLTIGGVGTFIRQ